MNVIKAEESLVARCGLYCGACNTFLKNKCAGCAKNEKTSWCAVRKCAGEKGIPSCAGCNEYPDTASCRKLNNFISKTISIFTGSDRNACIRRIRAVGPRKYAEEMSAAGTHSIKRK